MALDLVSSTYNTLSTVYDKQIKEHVNLVTDVEGEVGKIKTSLRRIEEVVSAYNSADGTTQRDEDEIQEWKEKAVDVAYKLEDLLDEWNGIIIRHQYDAEDLLANFWSCFKSFLLCFGILRDKHGIAVRLKTLNEEFNVVNTETERIKVLLESRGTKDSEERYVSTDFVEEYEIFGREGDLQNLINKLVVPLPEHSTSVPVFKITGPGGIGKTTLCQLVFNSKKIKRQFDKRRVWVSVGKNFDGVKILKKIHEGLREEAEEHKDGSTLDQYINLMRECIKKRFLIVLDGVWELNKVEWHQIRACLMRGSHGSNSSKILITTRFDHIATEMGATDEVPLGILSDEDCWNVISDIALRGKKEAAIAKFKSLGVTIAKKCKGFPLAAKALGNYLKSRQTQEEWRVVAQTELWRLKAAKDIFSSFSFGWNNLNRDLRRCFSYCSIFPRGRESQVGNMIRMWMAHGYIKDTDDELELEGLRLFKELAQGTFLELLKEDHEDDERITSWRMPQIMYDYAQYVSSKECYILTGQGDAKSSKKARHIYVNCDDPTSLRISLKGVHDSKRARSLFMETDHLDEVTLRLIFQLKCLRVLSVKDTHLKELLKEIGNLAHLRFLDVRQTQLTTFPDTICDLFNLQTLCCGANVERLPLLIGRLKSLRYLISTNKFMVMPQSIEDLTNLRCLPLYGVRKDTNKLGYLRRLNQIQGSMTICFLEALEQEQDIAEATRAELKMKKITQLVLDFQENNVSPDIVEALKPPPSLTSLEIKNFCSQIFPSWISSFVSLTKLELHHRSGFTSLPTDLWKLEALERLEIKNIIAERLTRHDFFGVKDIMGTGGISFPILSALTMVFRDNFTEWEDIGDDDDISVMPHLQKLSVFAKKINKLPYKILTKSSKLECIEFNGQPRKVQH